MIDDDERMWEMDKDKGGFGDNDNKFEWEPLDDAERTWEMDKDKGGYCKTGNIFDSIQCTYQFKYFIR